MACWSNEAGQRETKHGEDLKEGAVIYLPQEPSACRAVNIVVEQAAVLLSSLSPLPFRARRPGP
jgi:hypothetical protein